VKRLKSRHDESLRKQLVLHRETLRRLDAREMEQAVGGATAWYTCENTKRDEDDPVL
jgi:hypothetical protein